MLKFCFSYLKKYKINLLLYLLCVYLLSILTVINPIISGQLIDIITKSSNFECLLFFCIILSLSQIISIIAKYISGKKYIRIQTKSAYDMNLRLIQHVQLTPLKKIEALNPAEMTQQINNDSNAVMTFVLNLMSEFPCNLFTTVFSMIILVTLNWKLSVILFLVCIIYILIYFILRKKIYRMSYMIKQQQVSFFAVLLLQLKNIKFIKIHSLFEIFSEQINRKFEAYFTDVLKAQKFFFGYNGLQSFIITLANLLVFLIGGYSVMEGNMTIGKFTIIMNFFSYIIKSITYFGELGKNYQDSRVSYNRIQKIFEQKKERNGEIYLNTIDYIVCSNLSFFHQGHNVINNFCYTFKKGNMYCLVGRNGVGKTTLTNILVGLYTEQYSGIISYNDVDIRELNLYDIRKNKISVMEQNIFMLDGTVKENICYLTGGNIQHIDKYLNMKAFLKDVSLDKIIYDGKGGLSGGEIQKVAFLRMISRDSDVYILDEPTSALDKESKKMILSCLSQLKQDRIIILISHDSDIIEEADYKIYFE